MFLGMVFGESVLNNLRSINSQNIKHQFVMNLEFELPIDKELWELLYEECSDCYRHTTLDNKKTITFKFIEHKNREMIKSINEILKGPTFAIMHLDSDNEFVKFMAEIFLKYVDLKGIEF